VSAKPWHLLGDIGGTNARFALADVGTGRIAEPVTLSVARHPNFSAALAAYLAHVATLPAWAPLPVDGCLAVACSTERRTLTFTNSDWVIDREDLMLSLRIPSLHLINDFAAIGHAIPALGESDWRSMGGAAGDPTRPIGVLGPGTGLGVCTVLPSQSGVQVLPGEGGHVDFAPVCEEEIQILRLLLTRYAHVSVERLLSGAGLQNIYWALTQLRSAQLRHATPADISAAALQGDDPVAVEALAVFCRILGGVAGNLALTLGARGGIYVAGGIVPRIADFLEQSDFRERFLAKGRFRDFLSDIPLRLVIRQDVGLFGALNFLKGTV